MKIIFNKEFYMKKNIFPIILLIFVLSLSACNSNTQSSQGELSVLATTSIVYDVVQNVAGDLISVDSLLPIGADPHSFSPTPQDLAKLTDASLVFANGAGLETFLADMIENAGADQNVVYLSENNDLIESAHSHEDDHDAEDADHDEEEGEDHDHGEFDPHTWTSPKNVIKWVPVIAAQLSEIDPANAEAYQTNATAYLAELNDLDAWVTESVNTIPADQRKLITDHLLFAYFCRDYDFEQIGSVYSSTSTLAEPSAQEMADLQDLIDQEGVNAIFVGNTVSPELSERVASDTGAHLYFFYSGSLSDQDGDASTYIDYIKYNVSTFVDALAK
jgi:ABC-type Zn uptake system ZnuABC Zn-binding protein ZnuA